MEKLSSETIENELKNLAGWAVVDGKLHKEFQFGDFNEAWLYG